VPSTINRPLAMTPASSFSSLLEQHCLTTCDVCNSNHVLPLKHVHRCSCQTDFIQLTTSYAKYICSRDNRGIQMTVTHFHASKSTVYIYSKLRLDIQLIRLLSMRAIVTPLLHFFAIVTVNWFYANLLCLRCAFGSSRADNTTDASTPSRRFCFLKSVKKYSYFP
jgi:hypothetical protein